MFRPAHPDAALRGAAVGATSFAASLTAHVLAMRGAAPRSPSMHHAAPGHAMTGHLMSGHAMPGSAMPDHGSATVEAVLPMSGSPSMPAASLVLLAVACGLIGVLAARPRTVGARATIALLILGQGVGHLALGAAMGHLKMSPAMALAHLAAAGLAGGVIAAAEHALRTALAAVRAVPGALRARAGTVVAPAWTFRPTSLDVLARHGALRAPPA